MLAAILTTNVGVDCVSRTNASRARIRQVFVAQPKEKLTPCTMEVLGP